MKRMTRIIALAAVASLSASCTTFGTSAKVKETVKTQIAGVCDLLPPITYDAGLDTRETIDQVRRHNAKRNAFCQPKGDTK